MNECPSIQNASSEDWKIALQSWFSQKENPLWKAVQEYANQGNHGPASKTLETYVASLQQGNPDQSIIASFYSGLASFFPTYIQSQARKTDKIWDPGNGDLWSITNIILSAEVQVQKLLTLQENIKKRFAKFEQTKSIDKLPLTTKPKNATYTEYVASMIKLCLDYNYVDLLSVM